MKHLIVVAITLFINISLSFGQRADTVGFVRVSLIDVTPGKSIYSAFGHTALRMECPSEGLDYSFSYEMTVSPREILQFFGGKGNSGYVALPTEQYFKKYRDAGRGIRQYPVNLTDKESRRLWKLLDEEISGGMTRAYDYVHNLCSTMCIDIIERALDNERVEWRDVPQWASRSSRNVLLHHEEAHPWAVFIWQTILGPEGDEIHTLEQNLSPQLCIQLCKNAAIVNDSGATRPFLCGQPDTLLEEQPENSVLWTPTAVFLLLTVFTVVITMIEHRHRRLLIVCRVFDVMLLTFQTLMGLFLLYMVLFSTLVGTTWNWYLLAFNPLPILLILTARHRKWYPQVWLVFTVLLLLTVMLMPVVPQFDLPHSLIIISMMIRSYSNYSLKKINL